MRISVAFVLVASLATSARADTKRRVVVLDFDGTSALADRARTVVQDALADRFELVATAVWDAAMTEAGDDRSRWANAAMASQTDVVVEGWVDPDHRFYVAIRDAKTGRQFDEPVAATISDAGVIDDDATHALTAKLDVLLDFQATFDALHWPRSPDLFAA